MSERLYLDTAPVVYSVERVAEFVTAVDARLSTSGIICVVSDLTRLECRVKPLREENAALMKDNDEFFADVVAEVVSLGRPVIDLATEIRATHGFKTPDAIHLAAAVCSGCNVFLTNDHGLIRFLGITVEVVSSL